MKEFNFDFDSRFKEVGNQIFETTTNNLEKQFQNSNEDQTGTIVAELYFASLEASKEILKEYHTQLMNYLDKA